MASTAHLTALALGPQLPCWQSLGGGRVRGGAPGEEEERHEGGRGAGGAERVHQEIQQHHITHCRAPRLLHTLLHSLSHLRANGVNFDHPQGPRRGATPEEDLRRMHVREEEVYRGGRYQHLLRLRHPFKIIFSELVTVGHHRQSLLTIGVRR